jgi:hypothetical protein
VHSPTTNTFFGGKKKKVRPRLFGRDEVAWLGHINSLKTHPIFILFFKFEKSFQPPKPPFIIPLPPRAAWNQCFFSGEISLIFDR